MPAVTRSKRVQSSTQTTKPLKRAKAEVKQENTNGYKRSELRNDFSSVDKFSAIGVKKELKHVKVEIEGEPLPSNQKDEANVFKPVTDAILAEIPKTQNSPAAWHDIYNEIVNMRARFVAPVDTMGCERMPETITPNISQTKPHIYRFQLLISLMLSSQTKDEVNFQAMIKLQEEFLKKGYEDGLCLQAILDASESEIDNYISKVGFHKRKAAFIKKSCQLLVDNFDGDIPTTIEDIMSLPGVGPKMGYLLLQQGWKINNGIGVDVHLHRLAQMWHWVSKSDKPENTRAELESWLPKSVWSDINPLLVGFGQVICVPRANNCDICTLAAKGLCKSSNTKLTKGPMSQERKEKLKKQRGDLSRLLESF